MKTGIIRDIDKLGRVVIPKEMRKRMNMDDENGNKKIEVEIYTDGDKVIVKRHIAACALCGNTENLVEFKEKTVCKNCIEELNNIK